MPDKNFLLYGRLSWMDPKTYYSSERFEWVFMDTAAALEDGAWYQILVHCERLEMRYSTIC